MSLTKVNVATLIKKQYAFKLKAYIGVFTSLIVLQVLALFFSISGVGSSGTSSAGVQIHVAHYSADLVIVFTMLWSFTTAILITTKAYRNDDFSFVTNRVSSHLSNIAFLVTASIVGGVTAILSNYLVKVLSYFFIGPQQMIGEGTGTAGELVLGFIATIFYIFLLSALGYFVGTLVQLHRMFAILLPVVVVGTLFFGSNSEVATLLSKVFEFYLDEASILMFLTKVIITVGLLFFASVNLSNRMEVRQ